jgi:3-isopropylmalate dehydrogenase
VRRDRTELMEAGRRLKDSVDALLAEPATRTADLGGSLGTAAFGRAVAERIAGG